MSCSILAPSCIDSTSRRIVSSQTRRTGLAITPVAVVTTPSVYEPATAPVVFTPKTYATIEAVLGEESVFTLPDIIWTFPAHRYLLGGGSARPMMIPEIRITMRIKTSSVNNSIMHLDSLAVVFVPTAGVLRRVLRGFAWWPSF